jgi:NAD+ kinase
MQTIKTITFAVNTTKPGAEKAARCLAGIADGEGVQTKIRSDYPLQADALHGQDLCCAIGGDGTLLGVLDAALESGCAVLGVNMGKLGFLATFSAEKAARDLPKLIKGHYEIAERSILRCLTKNGESVYGLNDVVLKETTAVASSAYKWLPTATPSLNITAMASSFPLQQGQLLIIFPQAAPLLAPVSAPLP